MTDSEFGELLRAGRERRGVEFKRAGARTDKRLLAQVARAALGMANRRDGGQIVLGVEDRGDSFGFNGLDADDLDTWQEDPTADSLGEYADPYISYDLEQHTVDGRKYILLDVHPFDEFAVLCRKDYDDVLRKGACYVRSFRKSETTEIPTSAEMRELIELATDKALRRYLRRSISAGVVQLVVAGETSESDQELFEQQLGDLKL